MENTVREPSAAAKHLALDAANSASGREEPEHAALHFEVADESAPVLRTQTSSAEDELRFGKPAMAAAVLGLCLFILIVLCSLILYRLNNNGSAAANKPALSCGVVVVGGGAAGLFTAEALARNNVAKNEGGVCVFEKTTRFGGRVFDYWFAQTPNVEPVGLGAWRVDANHSAVWAVINRFSIPTRPWLVTVQYYEARGVITTSELDLKRRAFPTLLSGPYANYTAAQYMNVLRDDYASWPLHADLASFFVATFGTEAFNYFLAVSIVDGVFYAEDAAGEFDNTMFEPNGMRFRPLMGMSTITTALQQSAVQAGARLFASEAVLALNSDSSGYSVETQHYCISPSRVVIAVPPLALQGAMLFASAWWEPELTPLRAVRSSSCLETTVPYLDKGPNGEAVLHTVYDDGGLCSYFSWPGKYAQLTQAELDRYVLDQLRVIFPSKTIPAPLASVYQYWDAAWHYQKQGSGINRGQVAEWSRFPVPGAERKVFLVGEAYARARGWVEGAFESAAQALHDGWNLSP